jgi:Icc-related predicted phosphoesterase
VRVAALYDIHGNLPALEAVLAEGEAAPDVVVVGGDVVVCGHTHHRFDRA